MNNLKKIFLENDISLDDVRVKNRKFFPFHNKDLYKSLYVGQIYNTFLIFSTEENLIIVDQHAAHEQILFELNMDNYKRSKKENTYIKPKYPSSLKLNTHEYSIIKTNLSLIEDIGFKIYLKKNNTIFFHSCINFYKKQSFQKFVNLFIKEYKKKYRF